jgi:hypothetical protein
VRGVATQRIAGPSSVSSIPATMTSMLLACFDKTNKLNAGATALWILYHSSKEAATSI